jgi:hypothetical protein
MSLYLDGTIDPIAALNERQMKFLPKHFHVINLGGDYYVNVNPIRNWIATNQTGRFYIGSRSKIVPGESRIISDTVAAFEDSSEAIMFSFIAPTFKNDTLDIF